MIFRLIKQAFIELLCFSKSLSRLASNPSHVKCVYLNNQQCMTQPTLNLHCNKYIKGLLYYLFAVNLDICMRSCNTLNNLSNKACVPSKTKDLSWSVFNLITGINELKI